MNLSGDAITLQIHAMNLHLIWVVAADSCYESAPFELIGRSRLMSDVWAQIAELDPSMQSRLADVLETRGADIQQRGMREAFSTPSPFLPGAEFSMSGAEPVS